MTDLRSARPATRPTTPRVSSGARVPGLPAALGLIGRVSPPLAGRLAFEIWRRPWGTQRIRPDEQATHDGARVATIAPAGVPIRVYQWGDGARPVLLVHGWRSRASRFSVIVQALLESGFSPVSYDAPGHGMTGGRAGTILDHQVIMRALEERHGPFAAVVAHSLGVPFAVYAVRHGVRTRRLVTINGMCDFGYLVDRFAAELSLSPAVTAELRRAIERRLFGGDAGIWERFSATEPIDCDLLVVHDDDDAIVSTEQADKLIAANHGRSVSVRTRGLGHSRTLAAAEISEAVREFLGPADH